MNPQTVKSLLFALTTSDSKLHSLSAGKLKPNRLSLIKSFAGYPSYLIFITTLLEVTEF